MSDAVETVEKQPSGQEQHELLFGVRRSVRYHAHRRRFFEQLDKFIKAFTAIGGLGVFVTVLQKFGTGENWGLLIFGLVAGVLSIVDIVVNPDDQAHEHCNLSKDFIQLEKEIVLAGESLTSKQVAEFTARRLEIEAEEPPALRVLDTICHNELLRAMGYDDSHQKKVTKWQRFWSPLLDVNYHEAKPLLENKG